MRRLSKFFFLIVFLLSSPLFIQAASEKKQYIYDDAQLLNKDELVQLESVAAKYSLKREADILILTTDDPTKDVKTFTQDFYDSNALGENQFGGNAIILTINQAERELYIATFYQADRYIDADRQERIREKITPLFTGGNYFTAFESFLNTSYKYMGMKPGMNPDNLLFQTTFQLIASFSVALIVVGLMVYQSGGKVTVTANTYRNENTSKVLNKTDQYVRTTVSKRRKPSDRNKNGTRIGGGGGGITRGGHSHGGTRGKF